VYRQSPKTVCTCAAQTEEAPARRSAQLCARCAAYCARTGAPTAPRPPRGTRSGPWRCARGA
jgi:hypothetical protein